jgi:hypothetical protein
MNVLIARLRHLQRRWEVRPELKAVHAPLLVALRHLLVQDAAAGGHPLDVAVAQPAAIAKAVAVLDGTGEDVGDRLDTAVRMPRKTGQVIPRIVVAEIVEQQEWIEFRRVAKAEPALQPDAGAFERRFRMDDLLDRPDRHARVLLGVSLSPYAPSDANFVLVAVPA